MEKLIKKVLDKYNKGRITISHIELAKLIMAHIKVDKGWYLNLNSGSGQYEDARTLIEEYE
jgi:hypothetical protein